MITGSKRRSAQGRFAPARRASAWALVAAIAVAAAASAYLIRLPPSHPGAAASQEPSHAEKAAGQAEREGD